jgi:hypothetical protein
MMRPAGETKVPEPDFLNEFAFDRGRIPRSRERYGVSSGHAAETLGFGGAASANRVSEVTGSLNNSTWSRISRPFALAEDSG